MPKNKIPQIKIKYVDSDKVEQFVAIEWPHRRADGVDWVEIGHNNFTHLSGQSIYWLYHEGDSWVLGGGPVGYGLLPPEVIVSGDDQHDSRQRDFMPDLTIANIKLGWWWIGTDGPIDA